MAERYWKLGPLSHQVHTDWRCTTLAWTRGRWRPVATLRFGRASRAGFGLFVGPDEEGTWSLSAALIRADLNIDLSGPWERARA